MKKLMILAAVALMATVSQASKVNWSALGLTDVAGNSLKGSDYATFVVKYTIWDAAGTKALATDLSGSVASTTGAAAGSWSGASQNTQYWIQVVITDKNGNTLTSEKASFTTDGSATYKPNLADGTAMDVKSSKFDQSGKTYGWVVAPEPTSGLLLLLGVGALALRRRRA